MTQDSTERSSAAVVEMPRYMNGIETSMWRAEVDPRLRSTVCVLLILDQAPDWDRLREAHEWSSRVVQRFRQRVVDPAFGLGSPVWVTVPTIDLAYHLRRVHLPEPGTDQQLLELVQGVAMRPLDRARPLWEALLIEGLEDGKAAYFLKSHHSISDGLGSIQLMPLLFNRSRELRESRPEPPPLPPPDQTNPLSEAIDQTATSLVRAPGRALRAAGRLLEALREPENALDDGLSLMQGLARATESAGPGSPLLAKRSLAWRFLTHQVPLADLRAAAKAHGNSVNDAYLAAVLGGFRRYHEHFGVVVDTIPMSIPVSVRSADDERGGNKFSGIRFPGPMGEPDPVRRMALVREQVIYGTSDLVDIGGVLSPLVNRLPAHLLARASASLTAGNDVQASNVPGIPYPVYLSGAQVLRMYPFGPLPGCGVMVAMLSHNGTCCIGVNADAAAVTDPELFQRCLVEGFDEVIAVKEQAPRKAATKKAATKKAAAKKTTTRKTATKTTATKTTARKAPAKKAPADKAPATRARRSSSSRAGNPRTTPTE